jgi:chromosome segregation ATPase
MDDLAHSLKNFGKRGRTAARVEALRNQVAELEGKLAASDALVLQLKRASHKATGELERGERAVTDLKGELTKKNTRINRLQELYDGVCLQLSERGAQVGDLRVCVTELKAQVATLSERERASTDELEGVRQEAFQRNQQLEERLAMVTHRTMSLQDEIRRIEGESRAESSKTQRAEEQLVSANQQICELRTRIRALEQETLAKDTRVEQMRDRLGFVAQISYRLTAKLQQSNRARDQSVAITQELEDKIQGQDVIIRDLREKNQQKDRVIKQLEAKLQKQVSRLQ